MSTKSRPGSPNRVRDPGTPPTDKPVQLSVAQQRTRVENTIKLDNLVWNFKPRTFLVGWASAPISLTAIGIWHIFSRHHPDYLASDLKRTNTYFSKHLSLEEAVAIVENVVKNPTSIPQSGKNTYQIEGIFNGVPYMVGLSHGEVRQLYPLTESSKAIVKQPSPEE